MPISGAISSLYNFILCALTPFVFSDTEAGGIEVTYTKRKEIKVNGTGRIRIKFSLRGSGTSYTHYGQIYVNGSAFGTERTNTSLSYVEYTEDLNINDGDLVQVYSKTANATESSYISNFRLYGLPTSAVNL